MFRLPDFSGDRMISETGLLLVERPGLLEDHALLDAAAARLLCDLGGDVGQDLGMDLARARARAPAAT